MPEDLNENPRVGRLMLTTNYVYEKRYVKMLRDRIERRSQSREEKEKKKAHEEIFLLKVVVLES